MSLNRRVETRFVELHQDTPIERVSASGLILAKYLQEPRYFLASDIAVGNYGVLGFVLVDSRPEKRWNSYEDGTWTHVTYNEEDLKFEEAYEGSKDRTHFIDTDRGFRMIRHFVLPLSVRDFFARDRFLGDPLIDKCCREGTLPETFDEVPGYPHFVYSGPDGNPESLINEVIKYGNPDLNYSNDPGILWQNLGPRVYLSFHPWQVLKPVTEEGQESVFRGVANFDNVLSRFDRNRVLQSRGLEIQAIRTAQSELPEPGRPRLNPP